MGCAACIRQRHDRVEGVLHLFRNFFRCADSGHYFFLVWPNAQAEARATGTDTQTGKKPALWPVASSATLGAGDGRDTVRTRLLHGPLSPYPFSSFFSS